MIVVEITTIIYIHLSLFNIILIIMAEIDHT